MGLIKFSANDTVVARCHILRHSILRGEQGVVTDIEADDELIHPVFFVRFDSDPDRSVMCFPSEIKGRA